MKGWIFGLCRQVQEYTLLPFGQRVKRFAIHALKDIFEEKAEEAVRLLRKWIIRRLRVEGFIQRNDILCVVRRWIKHAAYLGEGCGFINWWRDHFISVQRFDDDRVK